MSEPDEHREEVSERGRARVYRLRGDDCEVFPLIPGAVVDERAPGTVVWIDVQGRGDHALIEELARIYGLHELAVEDALHAHQRAKVERYPSHLFVIARMVMFSHAVDLEQISLFAGDGFVLTIQDDPENGDPFDPIRSSLVRAPGVRALKTSGHLLHALMDAIVDAFFPVLDAFDDELDALEEAVLAARRRGILARIQQARRDVVLLRRALWPLRDAVGTLEREGWPQSPEIALYFRDTSDHVSRLIEFVEGNRETVNSLMELHLSVSSNRMNESMRVLAVISTVFIPLTFIAGVYGMNFDPDASAANMPELRSPVGYPVVMGVMALIAGALLLYFYRRGWFQSDNHDPVPEVRPGGPPPPPRSERATSADDAGSEIV